MQVDEAEICLLARRAVMDELGVTPSLIVLVAERSLPKTTSGKIQRNKAREHLLDGSLIPLYRHDFSSPTMTRSMSATQSLRDTTDSSPIDDALTRQTLRRRLSNALNSDITNRVEACIRKILDLDSRSIDLSLSLTDLGTPPKKTAYGEYVRCVDPLC